ncbi:class I SAM-dependent methyltransferase [Streptomyces litchfieldiae]|uniref:Methyltransferase domain-containing protein n=1 Tax=Streptomyces litchfieldiae TaxID=3075543 RepID=A0ABU2N187_9ACTN|nr:methyltransferase domain-containing protein [Streptomyces sp. DSM 44938]MDT0347681.1 methyltransferase domain-containing protein [Streptomyces sp. DSM 44938]
MSWYEDAGLWSGFADVLFSPERVRSAAEVVETSPLLAFPPGSRVLDQCCGVGVFTVPLARRGYRVTGLDLQAGLLERAAADCAAAGVKASFVCADAREPLAPESYDVIINMHTSFGYFDKHEDNLQVLRNAYRSLVPGGHLIVDLLSKEMYASWAGTPKIVDVPGGMVVMRDVILDDWARYRTDWTLVRGDVAEHASLTCYVYSAAELRSMLEAAGFEKTECFGALDGRPYDARATRLVVRGTKARPA